MVFMTYTFGLIWLSVFTACAWLQICGITCCGRSNFEQHCACKKHLRKAAIAAAAAAAADGTGGPIFEAGTYLDSESLTQAPLAGLQEQCRSYCKQVRLGGLTPSPGFAMPRYWCSSFFMQHQTL